MVNAFIAVLGGYLSGSIPSAYIAAQLVGVLEGEE